MNREFKRKYWYPISVDIERALRKFRIRTDALYRKIWPYIFAFWVVSVLVWGSLQFKHDYDLIHNYAHFETLSEGIYVNWRTDGSPGQEPPK
jgi:hypothetical protein